MDQPSPDVRPASAKAKYATPTIKVMDEDEVLKTFQLTSAMSGWWVPGFNQST